jgi:hypothetical protein
MADMTKAEQLIDEYIKCWLKYRPKLTGIWEDNELGCEQFQLIQNGFSFEDFNHDEISKLAMLLTKELRGQISRDNKFFWAYCTFLTFQVNSTPGGMVALFDDLDWRNAFINLVNLALSGRKRSKWRGNQSMNANSVVTQYINTHLLDVESKKWDISGPLTFSVLEGLMRRKNKDYMNVDGTITNNFSVLDSNGNVKNYSVGKSMNRVDISLRCFEQVVLPSRGRTCSYLPEIKTELCQLYAPTPPSDIYNLIYDWRNNLMHGNQYWSDRVPALLNLICLLVIDEVDPIVYDSKKAQLKMAIEFWGRHRSEGSRPPWDIYPPDISE